MPDKSFEITIPFVETEEGWRPIVEVRFFTKDTAPITFLLEFDTGAETICLDIDSCEWAFRGFDLQPERISGVGAKRSRPGKKTKGRINFLGQEINCEILFAKMESKTWRQGVIGRECFRIFGFGYWEASRELYATLKL